MKNIYDFSNLILDNYKSFGIDDVEVVTSENVSVSVKSRYQKLENIERSKNFTQDHAGSRGITRKIFWLAP